MFVQEATTTHPSLMLHQPVPSQHVDYISLVAKEEQTGDKTKDADQSAAGANASFYVDFCQ